MKNLLFFAALMALSACDGRARRTAGRIDIRLIVYSDPENDPYDMFVLPVSTIYFARNCFLEAIPELGGGSDADRTFVLVKDGKYAAFRSLGSVADLRPSIPLGKKDLGVRFANDSVPGYEKREDLTDTVMNGRDYRRARIVTDSAYAVFYVHRTDTVLPYSLSSQFDRDYRGTLDRVDTYEKYRNRFTSLRMTVSDTLPQRFYNALKQVKR